MQVGVGHTGHVISMVVGHTGHVIRVGVATLVMIRVGVVTPIM